MTRVRICLIGSSRHPVREPFAGGLEALTHGLARQLVRRGHEVTLFAAPGSDPALPVTELPAVPFLASAAARRDVNAPSDVWMAEHHAYLGLMLDLARSPGRYDVVHNNSLHHLPVAMAPMVATPVLTTLHTPPIPWLESAIATAPASSAFVAVSAATSRSWEHIVRSTPIHNGVDTEAWTPGPGGGPAVWTGRLVREKAPHLASMLRAPPACRSCWPARCRTRPTSTRRSRPGWRRTRCTSATSTTERWPGCSGGPRSQS